MRHLYQRHWTETVATGHSREVCSDKVKPGWLLYVHSCYLHLPEAKSGDIATIFLVHGGERHVLRSRARDAAKQGMSAIVPFHLAEHQCVVGYAPDANNGDEITLGLCAELVELKKWRKGKV